MPRAWNDFKYKYSLCIYSIIFYFKRKQLKYKIFFKALEVNYNIQVRIEVKLNTIISF